MYIGIEHWKAKQNFLLVQSHPFHCRTFMLTHLSRPIHVYCCNGDYVQVSTIHLYIYIVDCKLYKLEGALKNDKISGAYLN